MLHIKALSWSGVSEENEPCGSPLSTLLSYFQNTEFPQYPACSHDCFGKRAVETGAHCMNAAIAEMMSAACLGPAKTIGQDLEGCFQNLCFYTFIFWSPRFAAR